MCQLNIGNGKQINENLNSWKRTNSLENLGRQANFHQIGYNKPFNRISINYQSIAYIFKNVA